MKLLFNNVLIRPDRDNDQIILSTGDKLYLDTSFEKEKHSVCSGVVIKAPKKLIFNRENMNCALFDTDVEIKEGDHVIFHYLAIASAREQAVGNAIHIEKGLEVIPYDRIYVAIRNGEIIPVNGIVLVQPVEETITSALFIPETAREFSRTKGIVSRLSTPLRGYRDYPDDGPDLDQVKTGDTILYKDENCVPLEYSLHQHIDRGKVLYRMHRRDIDAILE